MSAIQDQVAHNAKLSNLHLTKEQTATFGSQLDKIVGYIDQLSEVDTSTVDNVRPFSSHDLDPQADIVDQKHTRKDLLSCSNQEIIADRIAINNIMN